MLTTSSQLKQETLENIEKNIYHNTWYQRTHVGKLRAKNKKNEEIKPAGDEMNQTTALNVFPRT